jgi:hypothetical protein
MVWDDCSKAFVMRISRGALMALPTLTVMIVMFAIFVAGVPRSYLAARIYGGPTEGVTKLNWRLDVVERLDDKEVHAGGRELAVRVTQSGRQLGEWRGRFDGSEPVEVGILLAEPASGPLDVSVLDMAADRVLGHASVQLTQSRWSSSLSERGGWLPGKSNGALAMQAAPGRGVFAVPFADPLWVKVVRDGRPAAGVTLTVSVDGAELRSSAGRRFHTSPEPPASEPEPRQITDAAGRATFVVAPFEHAATALIRARAGDGASGELRVSLPVVPGALHAEAAQGGLLIESPVLRDVAYYSLIDRRARLAGGVVKLAPHGDGIGKGFVSLAGIDTRPAWVVVSSEQDLRSPARVGWPLDPPTDEPPRTLEAFDHLLLDGARLGFDREQRRLSRVRYVTAALCAVALALSVSLLIARVRSADRKITEHLGEAGLSADAKTLAPSRLWFLVVAVLSVLLGFLVLTLLALYRLR